MNSLLSIAELRQLLFGKISIHICKNILIVILTNPLLSNQARSLQQKQTISSTNIKTLTVLKEHDIEYAAWECT